MASVLATKWPLLLIAAPIACATRAAAQGEEKGVETENATGEAERTELAKRQQSPLTEVMNVTLQSNLRMGLGETRENLLLVRVSPLLPIRVAPGWKVVVWPTLPLRSLPPSGASQERVNGAGDVLLRQFLTPARVRGFLWGIGPVAQLPSATVTALGTGKFSVGIVGVLGYRTRGLTLNLRPEHFRSVSGQRGRDDVEVTLLTPSVSYTLPSSVNVGVTSETIVDWKRSGRDRWTVPVMLTVSEVTNVGEVPINALLGAEYFAVSPANGPAWSVRLAAAFLFPIKRKEDE